MLSIAEMPKYEAYKDSGVDWLGDIPANWHLKPGFIAFSENKRDNKGMKEDKVLSLSYGNIVVKPKEKLIGLVPESFETYQLVEPGDIIIRCTDLQNDQKSLRTGLSTHKGIITSAYLNLRIGHGFSPEFLHYYLFALDTTKAIYKLGSGLRQNLSYDDFKRLPIFDLSYALQRSIVTFLDKKIMQINGAVSIKEQQIALLQERKQIIIQKAVTQGLNPNVPMKDSGVDWIGKIPKHWEPIKLKHLFDENNSRTATGKETLFSLRMHEGLIPHNEVSDTPISDNNLIGYKKVHSEQIVMNRMRASIGIFGIPKSSGLVSPDYAVFDPKREISLEYFLLLFKTSLMGTQFRLNSKGLGTGSSGFMRLYSESFGNIKVPLCCIDEQNDIVRFIEKESLSINQAINTLSQQISKLKEYKTTLINSAVTGKIKITPEMVEQEV